MSLMDKLKSMFSGGSADEHAGHDHDHSGHDHSHEPVPPADPVGMPTSDAPEEGENRL